jgi:hypothetical protein
VKAARLKVPVVSERKLARHPAVGAEVPGTPPAAVSSPRSAPAAAGEQRAGAAACGTRRAGGAKRRRI